MGGKATSGVQRNDGEHRETGDDCRRVSCVQDAKRTRAQPCTADEGHDRAEVEEHSLLKGPRERDEVQPDHCGDESRPQVAVACRDQGPRTDGDQGELTNDTAAVDRQREWSRSSQGSQRHRADVVSEQDHRDASQTSHPRDRQHHGPEDRRVACDEDHGAGRADQAAPASWVDQGRGLTCGATVALGGCWSRPPRIDGMSFQGQEVSASDHPAMGDLGGPADDVPGAGAANVRCRFGFGASGLR